MAAQAKDKELIVINMLEKNELEKTKILHPKDVKKILGCGMNKVYDIINSNGFPKIKIGNRYYIPENAFYLWLKQYTYKEYHI